MWLLPTGAGTEMATQDLYDMSMLEFDITPNVSGPLVFDYVFGECNQAACCDEILHIPMQRCRHLSGKCGRLRVTNAL
jgi:hypothetical protein